MKLENLLNFGIFSNSVLFNSLHQEITQIQNMKRFHPKSAIPKIILFCGHDELLYKILKCFLLFRNTILQQVFFQAIFYNWYTGVKTQSWIELWNSISSCVFFFLKHLWKMFRLIHLFFLLFGLDTYKHA